jgi:hypothetical protein
MGMPFDLRDSLYSAVKDHLIGMYGRESGLFMHRWLVSYKSDTSYLTGVHRRLMSGVGEFKVIDEQRRHEYELYSGKLYVITGHGDWSYTLEQACKAIQVMVDMMEPYLPLGSAVELMREGASDPGAEAGDGMLTVVVTQRMPALEESPVFFNYGAAVYPFGLYTGSGTVYFPTMLISQELHRGWSDDGDEAYMAMMKQELVIKRGYASFGFVSEELRKQALAEAGRQGGRQ